MNHNTMLMENDMAPSVPIIKTVYRPHDLQADLALALSQATAAADRPVSCKASDRDRPPGPRRVIGLGLLSPFLAT